jgi:hypothetical protein
VNRRARFTFFAAGVVVCFGLQLPARAQTSAGNGWKVPRLADGKPDLQGLWDFKTITPLDRPKDAADQKLFTDAQLSAWEKKTGDQELNTLRQREDHDRGFTAADRRTALIEDPADGKLPPLTPAAIVQRGSSNADLPAQPPIRYRNGGATADGPEMRGLAERCLMGFNAGPPMDPGGYNNIVQLIQTPNYLVIHNEMIHNARIVPIDGRPHLPDAIREWSGDSRGHWEGDTLVVETTNFTDKTAAFERADIRSARNDRGITALGTGKTLRLVERFTRPSRDIVRYEYTLEDPLTFTRPFTVLLPMRRLTGTEHPQIFEYACHEGNHALHDILAGARTEDRKSAVKGK